MNLEELLQEARSGNMVAQYDLAMHYGKLLKETEDEDEIYKSSLDAMLWLKKSAQQGYGPAVEAIRELEGKPAAEAERAGAKAEPAPVYAASDPEPVYAAPDPGPEILPEVAAEPEILRGPDVDEETAAAVAAAVQQSTAELTGTKVPARPASRAAYAPAERRSAPVQVPREHFFSSTTNLAVFCMLVVSLLLNILLLVFLFRMSREARSIPPVQPSAAVMEVTPSPTPSASPNPTPTETPAPTETPEPTPEVTPEPFWLDLSKYPKLEMKPSEDELYDDYVYYLVTADTLNMRAGPDVRYERLRTVPGMSKVGAVSKYGTWYLVSFEEDMGWVAGEYLTSNLNYQMPVSTTAPSSSSGNLRTWD